MTDYEYTLMDTYAGEDAPNSQKFGEADTADNALDDLAFYQTSALVRDLSEYPADRLMVVRREIGTDEWEPVPDETLEELSGAVV